MTTTRKRVGFLGGRIQKGKRHERGSQGERGKNIQLVTPSGLRYLSLEPQNSGKGREGDPGGVVCSAGGEYRHQNAEIRRLNVERVNQWKVQGDWNLSRKPEKEPEGKRKKALT